VQRNLSQCSATCCNAAQHKHAATASSGLLCRRFVHALPVGAALQFYAGASGDVIGGVEAD
jgi:hypothetical protein